jgi:hypothetical protein
MTDAGTHVFRVSLNPKLYREFEIPSERKLYALAKAIVAQFGFDFDHPFGFYSKLTEFVLDSPVKYERFADTGDDSDAGSVERTRIDHAFPTVGDTHPLYPSGEGPALFVDSAPNDVIGGGYAAAFCGPARVQFQGRSSSIRLAG